MRNYKIIITLAIALILSMLATTSAFAYEKVDCFAMAPGAPVSMYERPHTQSVIVNTLDMNETYRIADITKTPSELEPEGAYVLWLYLRPEDGTKPGWVMYTDVFVFGAECNKFGL